MAALALADAAAFLVPPRADATTFLLGLQLPPLCSWCKGMLHAGLLLPCHITQRDLAAQVPLGLPNSRHPDLLGGNKEEVRGWGQLAGAHSCVSS